MRILSQSRSPGRPKALGACILALCLFAVASSTVGTASAQEGQIKCMVTENGTPARGTIAVTQKGEQVASGSCGRTVSVPEGRSTVEIRLDGALDSPAQNVTVEVNAGKTVPVVVNFETGVLEVRIETKSGRGTGLVAVEKKGKRIGTIGSGVATRLSAGAYVVVVRLGGQEQRYEIDLRPGQRRLVRAEF